MKFIVSIQQTCTFPTLRYTRVGDKQREKESRECERTTLVVTRRRRGGTGVDRPPRETSWKKAPKNRRSHPGHMLFAQYVAFLRGRAMGANPVADVTREERKRAADTISETKGGHHQVFTPFFPVLCLCAEIIKSWHISGHVKTHCADVSLPRKFQPCVIMNGYGLTCSKAPMGQIARVETLSSSLGASSRSTDRRHF